MTMKGFTTIEAVIVVAVASFLVAMAGASMQSSIDQTRNREQANLLYETLLRARTQARIQGACVRVRRAGRTLTVSAYRLSDANPICTDPVPATATLMTTTQATFANEATLDNFNPGPDLVFRPDGSTAANATVETRLVVRSRTFTAKIFPVLGQVRVQ